MRYALVIVVVLCLLFATGFSMQREMSMEFEGEIEYVSITGSPVAESVVSIEGKGYGRHATASVVSAEAHQHDSTTYSEGLKVIVGHKMGENIYLQHIEGDGHLDMLFEAEVNGFSYIDIYADASITEGFYGRYIEIEVESLSLFELLRLVGTGEIKDWIRFAPQEDDE